MNNFITYLKKLLYKKSYVIIGTTMISFFTTNISKAQVIENTKGLDTTDYLNSYFIRPYFNSSSTGFRLKLKKVMLGKQYNESEYTGGSDKQLKYYHTISNEIISSNGDVLDKKIGPEYVAYIPEIIGTSEIGFYNSIPNKAINNKSTFIDVSELSSVDSFDTCMPTFNVIKNKLLTINYKDKKEESFVISTAYDSNLVNNGNITLTISLASENISDNTKNMLWRLFVIENNTFLALSNNQLGRLGFQLIPYGSYSVNYNGSTDFIKPEDNKYNHDLIASNGLYLFRKNTYGKQQLDPQNLIYLFKIETIE
jgi:hypothetical protein